MALPLIDCAALGESLILEPAAANVMQTFSIQRDSVTFLSPFVVCSPGSGKKQRQKCEEYQALHLGKSFRARARRMGISGRAVTLWGWRWGVSVEHGLHASQQPSMELHLLSARADGPCPVLLQKQTKKPTCNYGLNEQEHQMQDVGGEGTALPRAAIWGALADSAFS